MSYWSKQYFDCLIHNLKTTWPAEISMPFLSSLDNLLQDTFINFLKSVDNFESRTRNMLVREVVFYVPILTSIVFTFNWLTLTSEMHFVKFHPEVASCLLSRGKRKYVPLGMRLLGTGAKFGRSFGLTTCGRPQLKLLLLLLFYVLGLRPISGAGRRKLQPNLAPAPYENTFSGIPFNFTFFVISKKLQRIWSWNFGFANRKIWASFDIKKMYYFQLSPGGWECDRHKVL